MNRTVKRILVSLWLVFLAWAVNSVQERMDKDKQIRFVDSTPQFLPKGNTLVWMSLGYRSLLADWLWIRSVLYFGRRVIDEDNPYYTRLLNQGRLQQELDSRQNAISIDSAYVIDERLRGILYRFDSRGLMNDIYPLLDRVTTLDPHFIEPYLFGGWSILLSTGEIDKAVKLLEKGLAANPDRWELSFYLGWVEWMYRGRLESSRRYLLEAVSKPGCPAYAGNLLAGLSGKLDIQDLTREYLKGLMASTESSEIKKQIQNVLDRMGSKP